MQSFWYAVHQLLQGLVVSQRALHLGIIQSRCKKSQKSCVQKSCVQMQMFLILKKLVKIVVSYTQVEGKERKKNRKSRLVSAAPKKKRA